MDFWETSARQVIHYFSGIGMFIMFFFAWEYACYRIRWLTPGRGINALVIPCLSSLLGIAFFEFHNIAAGGFVFKTCLDLFFWFAGEATGVYGIIRKAERFFQIRKQIRGEE